MYYALYQIKINKRVDFGNKSELLRWIDQHKSVLNDVNSQFWYLYRTEKSPFNFCNRTLCAYICTLQEYIVKHKLLNHGKKEKTPRFCSPCGNRID